MDIPQALGSISLKTTRPTGHLVRDATTNPNQRDLDLSQAIPDRRLNLRGAEPPSPQDGLSSVPVLQNPLHLPSVRAVGRYLSSSDHYWNSIL